MTDERDVINALTAAAQTDALINQLMAVTAIEEEPLIALCDALTVCGVNPDGALESLMRLAYAGCDRHFLELVIADATTESNEDTRHD